MDYIDKLLHSEPQTAQRVGSMNVLGIRSLSVMAVPERAALGEIEEREAAILSGLELPLPFWDENGLLEPLNTFDFATLAAAGIDPTDFEIAVIEDRLERNAS
jgi:hypothetical protein